MTVYYKSVSKADWSDAFLARLFSKNRIVDIIIFVARLSSAETCVGVVQNI